MFKALAVMTAFIFFIGIGAPMRVEAKNMDKLDTKQQSIVTISAFTAKGDMEQLTIALNEGLDTGLTVSEVKEVLVQLYAYCGFPRSLNALGNFMKVIEARKEKGINDPVGKEASPYPTNKNSLEFGTENQTKLVGKAVQGPLYEFAPAIDTFLKGHLFGDIFGRDVLDWQDRELTTVAALASMEGVGPQLRSHIGVSMNVGVTEAQIKDLVDILQKRVGTKEATAVVTELEHVTGRTFAR